MRVKDVMTKNVVSVQPQATIAEAVDLMIRSHVSGLPVIDESGSLVGILSEGDLLRRSELGTQKAPATWLACLFHPGRLAEAYARTHGRRVDEIMSCDVATIDASALLEEAAAMMEERRVRRLPVVADEKVVGIVARADFVRALAGFVRQSYDEPLLTDGQIKERIEAELKAQPWAPVATVGINVENGVVLLSGILTDETQRQAVRIIAENVDGVRAVHDHMVWVEPYAGIVLTSPEDQAKDQAA